MFYRDGFIRSRTFDLDKLAFAPFVVLSETTGVDLTTTGTTDLCTIPSGQTPIILGTIFEVSNISSPTSDPAISVGIAAGETDIFPTSTLVAFDTLNKTYTFWTDAKSVHGVATDVIRMNVQTAAVATTLEADVKLIGFET